MKNVRLAIGMGLWLLAATVAAQTTNDYDGDNDGLISITTLAQLNAVRWDLDGNGTVASGDSTNYTAAFPSPATGMGCPSTGCTGYELDNSLNFDTDGDGDVDSSDTGSYTNWNPIGGTYSATFNGNGNTISNLTINRSSPKGGLFHNVSGTVRELGLLDVNLSHSSTDSDDTVAALAADVSGSSAQVIAVWGTGSVSSSSHVRPAGLIGQIRSGGRAAAIYFRGTVTATHSGNSKAAGLVSSVYQSTLIAGYFIGNVRSNFEGSGLLHHCETSTVSASYAVPTITCPDGSCFRNGAVSDHSTDSSERCTFNSLYWDEDVGPSGSQAGTGQTTSALVTPTTATGIFADWDDLDVAGDSTADEDPWSFGTNQHYPVLSYTSLPTAASQLALQDIAPSYGDTTIADKTYENGVQIQAFQIPVPSGGNGAYRYTLSGLPTGLVFDADGTGSCSAARTVCGAPTAVGAATVTVTVHDGDTNNAASDTGTLTFTITVRPPELTVSPRRLSLTEGGSTGSYTVTLLHAPSAGATITPSSDNPAVTVAPSTLTFTTTNWQTPQTVTVTAVADLDSVDEIATISTLASGGNYNSVSAPTVEVLVTDDEEKPSTDYDIDNDGLIDVDSLAKLNAMRWDLDGDGTASSGNETNYANVFDSPAPGMGCPDGSDADQLPDACTGYGLTANLDFDTNGDGDVDSADDYPNWAPIGTYAATFHGYNRTISNLTTSGGGQRGLFAELGTSGVVSNLGLVDVSVLSTTGTGSNRAGGLAAINRGTIVGSFVRGGRVRAAATGASFAWAGGIAGQHLSGVIKASYTAVAVSSSAVTFNYSGGVAGLSLAPIAASYATGTVTIAGGGRAGGLVGEIQGTASTITNSYATGVSSAIGTDPFRRIGGLVGNNTTAAATASYWDSTSSGLTASARGTAQTTIALQAPTAYGSGSNDIYANWDEYDTNADGTVTTDDDAWDFGLAQSYPVLKYRGMDVDAQRNDYDADGDGLVDISTLGQLNAVRYDLDGDGGPATGSEANYFAIGAFNNPAFKADGVGFCATDANDADDNDCAGYELLNDLDFDTNGNGRTHSSGTGDTTDAWNNSGNGWDPIGGTGMPGALTHFRARFDGNGHVIDHLFVSRSRNYSGLFAALSEGAHVTSLGLPDAYVATGQGTVGLLAGLNRGRIAAVWTSGQVSANTNVGGLVGGSSGTIVASYSMAEVDCVSTQSTAAAGGLAAWSSGTLLSSYSTGEVSGNCPNNLHGLASTSGTVEASYWDATTSTIADDTDTPALPPEGKPTADLQLPTDYGADADANAIYRTWDERDIDGDGATGDGEDADPWNFGVSNTYPVLKYRGLAETPQLNAQPDTAPGFSATVMNMTVPGNVAIEQFQIPVATAGNGTYDYDVTGLPAGLSFRRGRHGRLRPGAHGVRHAYHRRRHHGDRDGVG